MGTALEGTVQQHALPRHAPPRAPPMPEQVFAMLLGEFFAAPPSPGKPTPRGVDDIPLPPADADNPWSRRWIPEGVYQPRNPAAPRHYGSPVLEPALDYGRAFSYLGKLRTAEAVYADHYRTDQPLQSTAFHNDGQSLSDRVVDQELRRARFKLWGLASLDHGNPFEVERFNLYRLLMSEGMKELRQQLAM